MSVWNWRFEDGNLFDESRIRRRGRADKFGWKNIEEYGRQIEEEKQKQLEKKRHGEGCESEGEEPKRLRPDEDEEASQAKEKTSRCTRSWSWSGSFLDEILFDKLHGKSCEFEEEPKRLRSDENEESSQTKAKMSSVEVGRLFEVEHKQPEKKRHGEGCESEEEQPKQPRPEDNDQDQDMESAYDDGDDDDIDFSEGDSDGDDCTTLRKNADVGWWYRDEVIPSFWFEEGRRCHDVCHMAVHNPKFYGESLFELFKIRLIRNQKFSSSTPLEGPLSGEIALFGPSGDVFVSSYYRVSEKEPDLINFNKSGNNSFLLPLSGPNHGPRARWHSMCLICHFKFNHKDVFESGYPYKNLDLIYDEGFDTPKMLLLNFSPDTFMQPFPKVGVIPHVLRKIIGNPDVDRFLVVTYFAIYFGARATVRVEIFKKGVSSCSGFIHARPCVFSSRIRLLSIQKDEKLQLDVGSGAVKLTRSIVAVPSNSSLIIAAKLYDQDGEEIVFGKTFFPASEEGSHSKFIEDKDDIPSSVKVTVDWTTNVP